MAAKTKTETVPYDQGGNLMHYPQDRWGWAEGASTKIGPDWRDNKPFSATLTLDGTIRGRSAAYFVWLDDKGRQFPMFISDLADVLRNATTTNGQIGPRMWMVRKRGQNYGVRLATPLEVAVITPDSHRPLPELP